MSNSIATIHTRSCSTALIILAILAVLSGCSAQSRFGVRQIDRDGVDTIITSNEAKVTYIKQHGHVDRFCAYRESDVETADSQGVVLGIGSESIGEDSNTNAVALGGRSPAVLLARELMYRACELTMNLNTDEAKTIEVYRMFLDYASGMVKSERDVGSSAIPSTSSNRIALPASRSDDLPNEDEDTDESTDE